MNLEQIKSKAREMGINPEEKNKLELIHAIQEAEGFQKCYGKGMFTCNHIDCLWRADCCGMVIPFRYEVIE